MSYATKMGYKGTPVIAFEPRYTLLSSTLQSGVNSRLGVAFVQGKRKVGMRECID